MKNNNSKITALIAVKGNSERVPRKNIRPFADSSLLEIKLDQLESLNVFHDIIVSSENNEVLSKCNQYDVRTHVRDPFYSTSHVSMSDVYEYLAGQVKTEYIAWIPVTNPLVDGSVYTEAIEAFGSMDHEIHDSLVSVNLLNEYIYYNGKPLNFSLDPWSRSQDLNGVFAINFAINIISKKNMIEHRATVGRNPRFFEIQKEVALDIDYMSDFMLAEILYRNRG